MSAPPDERFKNKRANFEKALTALEVSVEAPVIVPRDLSGIIKDFEITYELSWTTLKVYLEEQGHQTGSARETFARAYQLNHLNDEDVWLDMIRFGSGPGERHSVALPSRPAVSGETI